MLCIDNKKSKKDINCVQKFKFLVLEKFHCWQWNSVGNYFIDTHNLSITNKSKKDINYVQKFKIFGFRKISLLAMKLCRKLFYRFFFLSENIFLSIFYRKFSVISSFFKKKVTVTNLPLKKIFFFVFHLKICFCYRFYRKIFLINFLQNTSKPFAFNSFY